MGWKKKRKEAMVQRRDEQIAKDELERYVFHEINLSKIYDTMTTCSLY